jgi:hypothetical protein
LILYSSRVSNHRVVAQIFTHLSVVSSRQRNIYYGRNVLKMKNNL